MASAEMLKMTRDIDDKVMGVDDGVKDVEEKVQDVRGEVRDVRGDVQDVGSKVQGAQTALQGISSETVFYDGFRPLIHQSTTTLHRKLITTGQLNGSFEAGYLISGKPMTVSCGYTENVRYSSPSSSDNP